MPVPARFQLERPQEIDMSVERMRMEQFDWSDYRTLQFAKRLLEHPGLTSRIAGIIGKPVERGFEFLPSNWRERVTFATRAALTKGMNLATGTLGASDRQRSQDALHKFLVTASGAGSGALGIMALPLELPVSTCLILRSIADIARSEGHDIARPETRMWCLEVFALGASDTGEAAVENGYWAVRTAMARAVSEAASYLAEKGIVEDGAPPLLRLIIQISSRFGIMVSEEVAAKAVPVVGAFGGATINYLFMDHFQKMARGHFIVRRLEARYGREMVQEQYRLAVV
jgi:hypothetical protein